MSSNDDNTQSDSASGEGNEEEEEGILDSHEQDRQSLNHSIDEFFLNTLEQAREKLVGQRDRLKTKYESVRIELERAEQTVDDLETERDSLMKTCSDEAMVTGDFFHRMKAYEYRESQLSGELKGLKAVSKTLNEQIKLQEKRNQRLQKKLESQLSKLPDGALIPESVEEEDTAAFEIRRAIRQRRMEGNQSIKLLHSDLRRLEQETRRMQKECEELREQIRDKSARLQTIPSESVNKISNTKHEIESEIELKKKQLRQLLVEEKSMNVKKNNINEKERILAEKMETSDPWETERKGLVDAIAHAQQEFQDLCNQLHLDPDNLPEQRSVVGDKRSPSQLSGMSESHSTTRRSKAPSSLSESRRNAKKRAKDDESDARSRVSQRSCASTEKVRYTHELLRSALKKELDSLIDDKNPINISIKIEEQYRDELDAQIANIEKAIEQINAFEKETFENTADNNQDNIMWQQRIDVLQNEYLELRTELRNSKV